MSKKLDEIVTAEAADFRKEAKGFLAGLPLRSRLVVVLDGLHRGFDSRTILHRALALVNRQRGVR